MKKKKIAADFLYCVGAVGMMNAVLQLIVYPVINNRVGGDFKYFSTFFWTGNGKCTVGYAGA